MSEQTQPPKKKRQQRHFGRVRFMTGTDGKTEYWTATMNKEGVTLRKLHSRRPQLLPWADALNKLTEIAIANLPPPHAVLEDPNQAKLFPDA